MTLNNTSICSIHPVCSNAVFGKLESVHCYKYIGQRAENPRAPWLIMYCMNQVCVACCVVCRLLHLAVQRMCKVIAISHDTHYVRCISST